LFPAQINCYDLISNRAVNRLYLEKYLTWV
jgi:hypothetical protein